jgi:LPS export ABC transporter protein LptC
MKFKNIMSKSTAAILFVAVLFACDSNFNEANKLYQEVDVPQGVTTEVNLFFTDSGKVKANLRSPKILDYSQEKLGYRIFPDGVEVDFFNPDSTKNTIYADSAIVFNNSSLVDMRKNVKIVTSDSLVLTTTQLYWDTGRQWVFTDRDYTITLSNGSVNNGAGFDANQEFSLYKSRSNSGLQVIEDEQ